MNKFGLLFLITFLLFLACKGGGGETTGAVNAPIVVPNIAYSNSVIAAPKSDYEYDNYNVRVNFEHHVLLVQVSGKEMEYLFIDVTNKVKIEDKVASLEKYFINVDGFPRIELVDEGELIIMDIEVQTDEMASMAYKRISQAEYDLAYQELLLRVGN